METARARERTRSSQRRLRIIVAGLIQLTLLAGGCAVPQIPSVTAPPTASLASPAVPQPASSIAPQPEPAPSATRAPLPAAKIPPSAEVQQAAAPPTLTAAPTATPVPALPTVSRPRAEAAPAPCSAGDAPSSVFDFPNPASVVDGCFLIGRSLTVNSELVSEWGSAIGETGVQVESRGCTWNGQLQYDYVYVVSYSCNCPTSLAAIPEEESGPWNVYFVGRTLCIDGNCTTEGSTAGATESDSWDCAQHHYVYILYWTQGATDFPEANTLLLMAGGLAGLTGWVTLQRRRRKRAQ
jgi:hypothetical protein